MLRFIIGIIVAVLYCIASLVLLLIWWIISWFSKKKAERFYFRIVQWIFRVLIRIAGAKVIVKGRENIPKGEAVLYVANHQSFFDVIISYTLFNDPTAFIAKKEFEKVPLLNINMKALSMLFMDRDDIKQSLGVIKTAISSIKEGRSIFIFPEGTRNKSGDELNLAPFHRGSFKPAQRTGCKIVPIAFNNTETLFEKNFPHVTPARVVVEIGKPVAYGDLTKDQQKHIDEYFRDGILQMLKKNQELTH